MATNIMYIFGVFPMSRKQNNLILLMVENKCFVVSGAPLFTKLPNLYPIHKGITCIIMTAFELLKGREFIELNKLLKVLGLAATGGEANLQIENGEVWVNDAVETQKRKKLKAGDTVKYQEQVITIIAKQES